MKMYYKKMVPLTVIGVLAVVGTALASDADTGGEIIKGDSIRTLGLAFSACITMAVSVIGSGIAVGRIGSAAMGAAAEKPELLTRSLLFVALAEGLAVLGFAIAIMLVQKI